MSAADIAGQTKGAKAANQNDMLAALPQGPSSPPGSCTSQPRVSAFWPAVVCLDVWPIDSSPTALQGTHFPLHIKVYMNFCTHQLPAGGQIVRAISDLVELLTTAVRSIGKRPIESRVMRRDFG